MAKILSPREYNIRSLAYYQAEGGVYNEIITVLTQMREEPMFRGLPTPAKSGYDFHASVILFADQLI